MKLSKTILAVLATGALSCALFSQQAQANTIQGSITFSGGATLDTGDANTAHAVTSFQNTVVQSVDGDFDTFINALDSATFSAPWVFNPSTPKAALWSAGGFTFDLLTSTIVMQGMGFLTVSGNGTILGNGFDGTSGTFNFSTQNPGSNGIFSFSAAGQTVPDGGSAVALLGLALTGIEVLRRKLKLG
jgi:VPDSG-CTERM motif